MLSLDLVNNHDDIEMLLLSHPRLGMVYYFGSIGIQPRCIVVADLLLPRILCR